MEGPWLWVDDPNTGQKSFAGEMPEKIQDGY